MKNFFLTYLAIVLLPINAAADIIYFKDGMKTVCQERAWEEGNEIKCEYEGTVLSYQKNDVLRIEKIKIKKEELEKPIPAEQASVKPTHQAVQQAIESPPSVPVPKSALDKEPQPALDNSDGLKTQGLEFYNPRRPHKYWTSATAKHDTLKSAIEALAKQYDRSPDWIQHHMGNTNDLDQIHRNLANSKLNAPPAIQADEGEKLPETLFYDPRRPHKYWTSTTTQYDTLKEAISALAKTYDNSPEWIQEHMGNTNNLNEIHHNLEKAKSADAAP